MKMAGMMHMWLISLYLGKMYYILHGCLFSFFSYGSMV